MKNNIKLFNVRTNNLKSIDININKVNITSIVGVSGGGKSSLAYNSLYEKSKQEFNSIETGYLEIPYYDIEDCKNLIPAVAIKQKNNNTNPRSTLYTYLNLTSILSVLFYTKEILIDIDNLKINKPNLQCKRCDGLGLEYSVSENKVVNQNLSIKENPFLPWDNPSSNKEYNLLIKFCEENNISVELPFKDLTEIDRNKLLSSTDSKVFSISFSYQGKRRNRKLNYIGVLKEITDKLNSNIVSERKQAQKFCQSLLCTNCLGSRIEPSLYEGKKIYGFSFVEFLTLPISDLLLNISFNNKLHSLLKGIEEVGLGYLALSRSIPSLSGGELQKLNLSKVCNSEITGILVVIDEISSQVHVSDYSLLFSKINDLKEKGNTVVLVEHNTYFIGKSDYVINVGPVAGSKGGFLLDYKPEEIEYIFNDSNEKEFDYIFFKGINKNNVVNENIKFPLKKVSCLVGKSGSGKTSIAKYLNDKYDDIIYISQEDIRGNINSTLASLTSINIKLAKFFSRNFDLPERFFSLVDSGDLVCKTCSGKGVIRVNRSFEDDINITCSECDGLLFSDLSEKYKFKGQSIRDLYNTELSEIEFFEDKSISKIIEDAKQLGLGHLKFNRKTVTLSGGEIKRVKLLSNLPVRNTNQKILIIDEPASGLDDNTARNVMDFICSIKRKFKSILVIDHKPIVFLSSDYIIEMGPDSGVKGGKVVFEGLPSLYYEKHKKYLI